MLFLIASSCRFKFVSNKREIEEIRINYFTREKNETDLIKTLKIINGISNYGRHFFHYFSSNWKFTVKTDFNNYVY